MTSPCLGNHFWVTLSNWVSKTCACVGMGPLLRTLSHPEVLTMELTDRSTWVLPMTNEDNLPAHSPHHHPNNQLTEWKQQFISISIPKSLQSPQRQGSMGEELDWLIRAQQYDVWQCFLFWLVAPPPLLWFSLHEWWNKMTFPSPQISESITSQRSLGVLQHALLHHHHYHCFLTPLSVSLCLCHLCMAVTDHNLTHTCLCCVSHFRGFCAI